MASGQNCRCDLEKSCQGGYVFLGICQCVCQLENCTKTTSRPVFRKLSGIVSRGPLKNPLGFGGNPDHITLIRW